MDKSWTRSVRGADGKRLNSVGMGVVYMKAKASPVWKWVEVVITKTGENFLLSHADLKNLNLLSDNFPEYLGDRRRGVARNIKEEEEITARTEPPLGVNNVEDDEMDILVSQGESMVTLEIPDETPENQSIEAEAYAALFAVGGYTYSNVVHEADDEQCNTAKSDDEESDQEEEDIDGIDEMDKDVDEESLINQKTPYEQKFIKEHRGLFSKTLNPSQFLKCPPMKIKLKQSLSSKMDPSLYRFKPRTIPMHIKEQAQQLLDDLEKQGIIRRMGPNETSEVCAPAGFVPKKSKKLRFVIDFTSLNKYIACPVHSFPSSDQIQQAI